ncbi:MAG: hypothetical protein AAGK04_09840 [Planctomycetota bacterium]
MSHYPMPHDGLGVIEPDRAHGRRIVKQFLAGLVAGLIGAAVWAAVVAMTGFEVGIIAWALGALVGFACAASGSHRGVGMGVLASLIAIAAIGAGKLGGAWFVADQVVQDLSGPIDDEFLVSYIADETLADYEAAGYELDYPPGADLDFPTREGDYPVRVWSEASGQWEEMSGFERQELREQVIAERRAFHAVMVIAAFFGSFGVFDLLWMFLAVGSAFKLAASEPESDSSGRVAPPESEEQSGVGFFGGHMPAGDPEPRTFDNADDLDERMDRSMDERAA